MHEGAHSSASALADQAKQRLRDERKSVALDELRPRVLPPDGGEVLSAELIELDALCACWFKVARALLSQPSSNLP